MIRNPSAAVSRLRRSVRTAGAAALVAFVAVGALLAGAAPATAATDGDKYVIGTDTTFAPFEFTDQDGDLVGIDMDLLRAIAKDQGFEVEIRQLGFDAAVQALQSNQVDAVMAGMSITEERQKAFDFSEPYFTSGVQLGVLEASDIQSLDGRSDRCHDPQ
ncbi:transporter substrate-binding domain-containing protein [Microbacterium maritypicum]